MLVLQRLWQRVFRRVRPWHFVLVPLADASRKSYLVGKDFEGMFIQYGCFWARAKTLKCRKSVFGVPQRKKR